MGGVTVSRKKDVRVSPECCGGCPFNRRSATMEKYRCINIENSWIPLVDIWEGFRDQCPYPDKIVANKDVQDD